MSRNLHEAAAPRGRCQSLPKVRHAARHCHRFMSQVWHVPWRLCVRCHRFGMWCVRCHRFGMCHGVCASDVMASVRQMSCHVMLKLPLRRINVSWLIPIAIDRGTEAASFSFQGLNALKPRHRPATSSVANYFQLKVAKVCSKSLNVARWRHAQICILMT